MDRVIAPKKDLGSYFKLLAPVLVAIPALSILFLTFFFTSNQLNQWAKFSLRKTGQQVIEKTVDFLHSADLSAHYNATWIASQSFSDTFASDYYTIAKTQMFHYPHFQLIYFGDKNGNHWLNKRDPDDVVRARVIERLVDDPVSRERLVQAAALSESLEWEKVQRQQILAPIVRTSWYEWDPIGRLRFTFADPFKAYDPRLRPWYTQAQITRDKSWIDVYTWENKFENKIERAAGITMSYPVIRQGDVIGVTGIDLVLEEISRFLGNIKVSANSRTCIFDSKGQLVGLPGQKELLRTVEGGKSMERVRLADIADSAIADSYRALREHLTTFHNLSGDGVLGQFEEVVIPFKSQEKSFLGFFQPLDPSFRLDWSVGILVPEEDIVGNLTEQFRWVFVGIIVVVLVLLGLILMNLRSEKDRRWIQGAFSKYVSPNRVEYLLKNPGHLSLGGEYRECSFVMTDLKGFTSLMEMCSGRFDPEVIVNMLNEYLEGMVGIAFQFEGTLDRIVGDSVAVLFSAPVSQDDHAQRAVACALAMDRFASDYSRKQQHNGLAFGHTRIGVNSGRVLLGNFGGRLVFDYRALGDPINVASRLESINDTIGTHVLVSGETVTRLPKFCGRLAGVLVLKGKEVGIRAYEPMPEEYLDSPLMRQYEEAYRLMAMEDPGALAAFAQGLQQWPDDPLMRYHHTRLAMGERGERVVFNNK